MTFKGIEVDPDFQPLDLFEIIHVVEHYRKLGEYEPDNPGYWRVMMLKKKN